MLSHFPCCPVNRECLWKKTQIEKKNSSDCFSFILVSKENIFREKPWKSKTQVTSCELLVQIYGLRVRIYE